MTEEHKTVRVGGLVFPEIADPASMRAGIYPTFKEGLFYVEVEFDDNKCFKSVGGPRGWCEYYIESLQRFMAGAPMPALPKDRAEAVIILDRKRQIFHFAEGPLRKTGDILLWFPMGGHDVFTSVELVMQVHGVAHHVVHVQDIRTCGDSTDYLVTYSPGGHHV